VNVRVIMRVIVRVVFHIFLYHIAKEYANWIFKR
jgi:hypothetical protein